MTRPDRTLRDLIDGAMHRHQVKHVSNLERIAKRADHKIVATTISAIRNGTYNSEPSRATLAALAFLAGVTPEEAYAAAGLPVPGPPFAESLPDGVDLLSPTERKAVIGVLRAMVDARRALSGEKASVEIGFGGTEGPSGPDGVISRDGFVDNSDMHERLEG